MHIVPRGITARLLLSYLGILAVLAVAWAATAVTTSTVRAVYSHTVHTVDALNAGVATYSKLMDDEETGLRGYLLTRDPRFMQPWSAGHAALSGLRRRMDAMIHDTDDRALLDALDRRAAQWEGWARPLLASRAASAPALAVRQQLRGKELFDRLRAAASALTRELTRDRLRDEQTSDAALDSLTRLLALLYTGLVAAVLLIALATTHAVRRPIAALDRAAAAIGHGDLSRPVAVAGVREFTRLAARIEWMRRELISRQQALYASEQRFRGAFDQSAVGMSLIAPDGRYLRVNAALCRFLGYTEAELLARTWQSVTHPDDLSGNTDGIADVLGGHDATYSTEKRYRRKDGRVAWGLLSSTLIRDAHGAPLHFISQVQDISALKAAEAHLTYQAHHDVLTALPNRVLFQDRLGQALRAATRHGASLGLLLLDLDGFKAVNDTLGHDVGDTLLRTVATRLETPLRGVDTVARLGGDEFAVLLPETGVAGAEVAARKLLAALGAPLVLAGRRLHVGGSIGIATYPEHGMDGRDLLRHADIAMYAAKRAGGGVRLYTPEMDEAPDLPDGHSLARAG